MPVRIVGRHKRERRWQMSDYDVSRVGIVKIASHCRFMRREEWYNMRVNLKGQFINRDCQFGLHADMTKGVSK